MATKSKKTVKKLSPLVEIDKTPRVRSLPKHRTFRLSKKRLTQPKPIPSALSLIKKTFSLVGQNKRLFIGVVIVQAVIGVLLVSGIGNTFNVNELKKQIEDALGQNNDRLGTAATLLTFMASSLGSQTSEASGVYQMFLILFVVLATIWLTRQLLAGEKPRLRDGFYKGMYPLIPFMLVMIVVAVQLIPALVGNVLYSTVIAQGLAISTLEKVIWLMLFLALAALSFYMLASSLFALYIVTLPDMTPFKALRSARELVLHRRLGVMIRIVAFPILLTVISIGLFIPLLIFATVIAGPLFLLASGFGLVLLNVYMYNLYRALL